MLAESGSTLHNITTLILYCSFVHILHIGNGEKHMAAYLLDCATSG
jgi:hypothetical protein